MPISTFLGNAILNHVLRGEALATTAGVYVSLHHSDPLLVGSSEFTAAQWPSYTRLLASAGGAMGEGFGVPVSRTTGNSKILLFPGNDGAAPLTITHFGIWDRESVGNFLLGGAIQDTRTGEATSIRLELDSEIVFYPGKLSLELV